MMSASARIFTSISPPLVVSIWSFWSRYCLPSQIAILAFFSASLHWLRRKDIFPFPLFCAKTKEKNISIRSLAPRFKCFVGYIKPSANFLSCALQATQILKLFLVNFFLRPCHCITPLLVQLYSFLSREFLPSVYNNVNVILVKLHHVTFSV